MGGSEGAKEEEREGEGVLGEREEEESLICTQAPLSFSTLHEKNKGACKTHHASNMVGETDLTWFYLN